MCLSFMYFRLSHSMTYPIISYHILLLILIISYHIILYSCHIHISCTHLYILHFLYFSLFHVYYIWHFIYLKIMMSMKSHLIHILLFLYESTLLMNWNQSNRIIQIQIMAFSCQLVILPIFLGTVGITYFPGVLTSYLALSLCTLLNIRC